jgi:hypothetical protein
MSIEGVVGFYEHAQIGEFQAVLAHFPRAALPEPVPDPTWRIQSPTSGARIGARTRTAVIDSRGGSGNWLLGLDREAGTPSARITLLQVQAQRQINFLFEPIGRLDQTTTRRTK